MRFRCRALVLSGWIAVAVVVVGCGGGSEDPTPESSAGSVAEQPVRSTAVRGTVVVPPDVPIPEGAVVTVRLADVSRQDVPADILVEQSWAVSERDSLRFELPYDPGEIDDRFTYAVQARIEVDGALHMISTTAVLVLTRGRPTEVEVPVEPVHRP